MKSIIIFTALLFCISALYTGNAENGKIRTKVISTYGMHCSGCEETIETEIKKLNGIKSVKADHINKKVTVKYDDKKVTLDQIKQAIIDAGYKLSE